MEEPSLGRRIRLPRQKLIRKLALSIYPKAPVKVSDLAGLPHPITTRMLNIEEVDLDVLEDLEFMSQRPFEIELQSMREAATHQ